MGMKVFKNVIVNWAHVNKVDDYGKYSAQLVLDKEMAKKAQDLGLKPKKDKEGKTILQSRRDPSHGPIVLQDVNGTVVTATPANGAVANVMLDVYTYKKFGGGISSRLEKIQLLQWEPYGSDGDDENFDEDPSETEGEGSEGDELF